MGLEIMSKFHIMIASTINPMQRAEDIHKLNARCGSTGRVTKTVQMREVRVRCIQPPRGTERLTIRNRSGGSTKSVTSPVERHVRQQRPNDGAL